MLKIKSKMTKIRKNYKIIKLGKISREKTGNPENFQIPGNYFEIFPFPGKLKKSWKTLIRMMVTAGVSGFIFCFCFFAARAPIQSNFANLIHPEKHVVQPYVTRRIYIGGFDYAGYMLQFQ